MKGEGREEKGGKEAGMGKGEGEGRKGKGGRRGGERKGAEEGVGPSFSA